MTTHDITRSNEQNPIPPKFMPMKPSKDEMSRLGRFANWINDKGYSWVSPDLSAYRDHLLETLSPRSVKAHLSTVRKALQRVARDRDFLYHVAATVAPEGTAKLDLKPMVDEFTTRIDIATHPDEVRVKTLTVQDASDAEHVRLTAKQANELIHLPDRSTLAGLRDAALIGLALATGLRADELVSLKIDDLYHRLGGKDALLVREGKGFKQRLVPYGAHISVLQLVHKWMNTAGIASGYIFRGVTKGVTGKVLDEPITVRTFERRLLLYPVDGLLINPHDLRRTYAKQQYLNGMDIVAIKDNLGHASIETTLDYIGEMNAEKRVPSQGYQYL
jgi:integrase